MDNTNKNNANQAKNTGVVRKFIFFLIAITALIVIFWAFSSRPKGKEANSNFFISELEANHITEVEFTNSRVNFKTNDDNWYWFYNRSSGELTYREIVINHNKENNLLNEAHKNEEGYKELAEVIISEGTSSTFNFLSILYPVLLLVVLGIMIYMVVRQIRNVNNRGMEFTKNRARVAQSKIRFDKVAGADEEKAELEEIIQFLKDPDKFTRIGARIPKGVLLVGPPGTGKTLLAKAVAGEANVPFFTISGSDFMELYVGVGASRVRDLFENAKLAKPCIVFIDEIDAVGRQRGTGLGGGNDEREQTLNQLLVQMDGFDTNEGIIVMAATNRADILDPALTRPGRFDRQIYINIPDVKGREEILRVHAVNKPLASDVKLKEVARVTSGFTGADLENLLNEAAIFAARRNRKTIAMEDINNAITKVTMGPQKRSRIVTDRDKKITAYHESGHAIVEKCIKTSDTVHEVSIIQRGGAAGYTMFRPDNDESHITKQKLYDTISVMLGGRGAEETFLDDVTTGASNDLGRATEIARKMVVEWGMSDELGLVAHSENNELFLGRDYQTRVAYSEVEASKIDAEIKKIIDKCYKETKNILNSHKKEIETMVTVLLEKETIYADEVNMILNGASAEEVIKFIEEQAKVKKAEDDKIKAEEEAKEKQQVEAKQNYVENLLKEAEKRAEQKQQQQAKVEEVKTVKEPVKAEKEPSASRETSAEKKEPAQKKTPAKKEASKTEAKTEEKKPAGKKTTKDKNEGDK